MISVIMRRAMLKDLEALQQQIGSFIEAINQSANKGKHAHVACRLLKICLSERNALVEDLGGWEKVYGEGYDDINGEDGDEGEELL